ncbi:protein Shroom-like isoform X2 [Diorhabda sublineata]|uniref:protein Shroom-like isoform X2 n=1 Tax=Diorhabda sublineata TaxID=1163346 RepID=UPI0024E16CCD|nr:protein Shroom-like isoform X2 [Diorhabda sublineata]
MMPSRSTPNLKEASNKSTTSIYAYLEDQSGSNFTPSTVNDQRTLRDDESPPPAPPVRDSSSLKSINYGPGHEKFPSWPVPAAAETPQALRNQNNGGSHRSKSWTDHTNYPKEKVVTYTRPYMKRQHSAYTQQKLKTVMEKCEKIPPETFESRYDKVNDRIFLPTVDQDGKILGDMDYMVPSPPERDISTKPQLTQSELEEYARSYQEPKYCDENIKPTHGLIESGLEEFMEYTRNYEDSLFDPMNTKHDGNMLTHIHQKQISYAQSEGYHSYVSSTDSTSTPFLDRLRRDSEAVVSRPMSSNTWDEITPEDPSIRSEGRDSVVTTSSGSASSSETLKWHGSMSDVSVTSHSSSHHNSNSTTRQLIAHSARVQTPQRHHSESVLYMSGEKENSWKDKESRNNNANKLKLFPLNTYTVQESEHQNTSLPNNSSNRLSISLQSALSVADRISELEKQHKYSYYDPEKKHRVPDPTLKAIQKKALLSFYERHNNPNSKSSWRSEPQLAQVALTLPPPPPKIKVQMPSRRASSASDYASGGNSKRSSLASSLEKADSFSKIIPRHQHSNSCGSLSTDMLGPMIIGPSISVDDYVPDLPPARPPKNPSLRNAFPDLFLDQRVPSPDLPPPSPPTVLENEVFNSDEPLPPPPPECEPDWQEAFKDRLRENSTGNQVPAPQVQKNSKKEAKVIQQTVGLPERYLRNSSVRSSIKTKSTDQIFHQVNSKPYTSRHIETPTSKPDQILGFPNQRGYQERSSTRYPSNHKLSMIGNIAASQKVNGVSEQCRPESLGSQNRPESKQIKMTSETHRAQRASISESPGKETPPPLQPRQMRINQSMRARISTEHKLGSKEDYREQRSSSISQSKASYLTARRDRDRIIPGSESGSYKRTMSPNGHALPPEPVINDSQKARETLWPSHRLSKNNSILRRASMNEKKIEKCDEKEELKKNLVLPDVLPVNVKLMGPRSQYNRPSQMSLVLDNNPNIISPKSTTKSQPSSPPKSPSRNSPLTPLRTTTFSTTPPPPSIVTSSPITTLPSSRFSISSVGSPSSIRTLPATLPRAHISPSRESKTIVTPPSSPKRTSSGTPKSPRRNSPPIKPTLSPSSSSKLSPVKIPISPSTSLSQSPSPSSSSPNIPPASSSPPPLTSTLVLKDDYPQVIEGLQLIQRTEVVLRVNATTTDASSQTEKEELPPTPLPTRKKLKEEIEYEKLAEDLIDHLPSSDRLKELLVPLPEHKKPSDYVQGLFRVDVTSRPRPLNSPFRSKNNTPSSTPPPTLTSPVNSVTTTAVSSATSKFSLPVSSPISPTEPTSPLSGSSTYFTTSEPKAKLLTRYSQDMKNCHILKNTKDLSQKKEELVSRLDKKLEVLRSEQLIVGDECRINDELGENVEVHINRVARPYEVAKFRLHVEEIGKITSLLLSLSGRLARAENALMGMSDDDPERRILEAKRDKLLDQLEEAKKLKESIDRRSVNVSNILYKYLNSEEYADYDHFINMKAKLLMDSKEISDKIKLGEEQLLALKETLIFTD